MGLINWYKTKAAQSDARLAQASLEKRLSEHWDAFTSNIARDTDEINGLFSVHRHGGLDFRVPQINRNEAVRISRNFIRIDGHAKNIQNQIVNHVVGIGFNATLKDKTAQASWEETQKTIKWFLRSREIVTRVYRDGECFLRKFGDTIRFIEPERIGSPNDVVNNPLIVDGVQFDGTPEAPDYETPIAYFRTDGTKVVEIIPAEEVYHIKDPYRDMSDARGWPVIIDPMKDFEQYKTVVDYRIHLNKIRAAYAFVRTHEFSTPKQIDDFISNTGSGQLTDSGGRVHDTGNVPAGMGLEIPAGQKIEFMPPNVGAADVAEDLRALRLMMGTHFSLPEYIVSGDASNSNFASTAVAESPGVRALQSWQQFYAFHFEHIIEWLLGMEVEPDFVFPTLVVRDHLKEQQARQIQKVNDVLSVETWQELEGIDPDTEQERIDKEREERMERAPDLTPSEPTDDDEEEEPSDEQPEGFPNGGNEE
jgi:hypothetical protein